MTEKEKPRLRGKVLWFKENLGYGFIRDDTSGADYFVHHTQLEMDGFRRLEEGQVVEFQIGKHNDKLQADKVVVIQEV